MHQLHYADEIRPFAEVPIKDAPPASAKELELAGQIIQQIARKDFEPSEYRDEVRDRMQALIDRKIEGMEIVAPPEAAPQAQIIDLMEALKQSLGMKGEAEARPARKAEKSAGGKAKAKDKPVARAARKR
jgi:DNA end-binding protein Ku